MSSLLQELQLLLIHSFVAVGIKRLHDNLSKEEPFEKVKANPKQYY